MPKSMSVLNQIIHYGRYILVLSLIGFIICLLISYPYAESFTIPAQVSAHILTIILAGIFKLTVVALMAASKELKILKANSNIEEAYVTA